MSDEKQYKNLLDEVSSNYELPKGYDQWGIRSVHPDLRSRYDYRWPFPGRVAKAPGPIVRDNKDGCPFDVGDGICVAKTWASMASGSIPAITLLLVAYNSKDVLGQTGDEQKLRLVKCRVVDVIDGARLVRESGAEANLWGADLREANLREANLRGANIWGANFWGANLREANIWGANLWGANLREANLWGANLREADLREANLWGANLRGANLWGADLREANLREANLRGANLRGADLREAWDVEFAYADRWTELPSGFLVDGGRIKREATS